MAGTVAYTAAKVSEGGKTKGDVPVPAAGDKEKKKEETKKEEPKMEPIPRKDLDVFPPIESLDTIEKLKAHVLELRQRYSVRNDLAIRLEAENKGLEKQIENLRKSAGGADAAKLRELEKELTDKTAELNTERSRANREKARADELAERVRKLEEKLPARPGEPTPPPRSIPKEFPKDAPRKKGSGTDPNFDFK